MTCKVRNTPLMPKTLAKQLFGEKSCAAGAIFFEIQELKRSFLVLKPRKINSKVVKNSSKKQLKKLFLTGFGN